MEVDVSNCFDTKKLELEPDKKSTNENYIDTEKFLLEGKNIIKIIKQKWFDAFVS